MNINRSEWKVEIFDEVLEEIRKFAMKVDRGVVMRTPVDVGRLRANWQVSLNQPIKTSTEDLDRSGGPTIAKALSVISRIDKTTSTVHITNNLVYAIPIENGHGVHNNPGVMVAATLAILNLS